MYAASLGDAERRGTSRRQTSVDQLVEALVERLQEMYESDASQIPGVSSGFVELDRLTAGMHGGDLIVVAARPSMGKSSFALTIAQHVAVDQGLPVLLFSMEMDQQQLAARLASSNGGIEHQTIRTGALCDSDWVRLSEAVDRLGKSVLVVDDEPGLELEELCTRARERAVEVGRFGLIVVDYLQLMSAFGTGAETRAVEVGSISRGLKSLARELCCPVMVLSQLNRAIELRRDKRPMLSDLRDSGAIEEDADVVLFIHRDDYYSNAVSRSVSSAEVIVGKQRNGPTGTIKLAFDRERLRFGSAR